MTRRVIALVVLLAACGRHAPAPRVGVAAASDGGVRVWLAWSAPVDLDLYVTDPRGDTYYYARRGSVLDAEVRCDDMRPGAHEEHARFAQPRPGRYRVGVDFPHACGTRRSTVPFRVIAVTGSRRHEAAGTARLGERQPQVLEFDVEVP